MAFNAFESVGIKSVRIHGAVTLQDRDEAFRAFRNDESVRVLLITITSGGVGCV